MIRCTLIGYADSDNQFAQLIGQALAAGIEPAAVTRSWPNSQPAERRRSRWQADTGRRHYQWCRPASGSNGSSPQPGPSSDRCLTAPQ
jgi:hypothetical protein